MRADRQEISAWRVLQDFAPLLWSLKGRYSFVEVVIVEDHDISVGVADGHVRPLVAVGDGPTLLL